MKKKILGGLLVVAIAAVAAFNVNMNTEKNEMSALMLANVEALASGESGGSWWDRDWFSSLEVTAIYDYNAQLAIGYKGFSLEFAGWQSGYLGYIQACASAFFSTCDTNDNKFVPR